MANYGIPALPRHVVVPLATAASHRAKIIAIVFAPLGLAFLAAGIADVVDNGVSRNDWAALFWVCLCWLVAGFAVRRAKRAKRAAEHAASDEDTTWTLVDKLVVATDGYGQPAHEYVFKITGAQRKMLLAVPTNVGAQPIPGS